MSETISFFPRPQAENGKPNNAPPANQPSISTETKMPNNCCMKCQRALIHDEIALYKRLVNRGATEYLCLTCFAEKFQVTEEQLHEKIALFREMGCTLF